MSEALNRIRALIRKIEYFHSAIRLRSIAPRRPLGFRQGSGYAALLVRLSPASTSPVKEARQTHSFFFPPHSLSFLPRSPSFPFLGRSKTLTGCTAAYYTSHRDRSGATPRLGRPWRAREQCPCVRGGRPRGRPVACRAPQRPTAPPRAALDLCSPHAPPSAPHASHCARDEASGARVRGGVSPFYSRRFFRRPAITTPGGSRSGQTPYAMPFHFAHRLVLSLYFLSLSPLPLFAPSAMAPPKFADIGKAAKDLFSDDFGALGRLLHSVAHSLFLSLTRRSLSVRHLQAATPTRSPSSPRRPTAL